jgi:glutamate racemase
LPDSYRSGVVSIIAPSAREAVRLGAGRIGIIATEATVKSRAFENEILSLDGNIELRSVSAQPLVAMVESGERDGSCSDSCRGYLEGLLKTLSGCDLLILGCTHFTHLEKTVEAISGIKTLSPSRIGASVMAQRISGEGEGKTCYL